MAESTNNLQISSEEVLRILKGEIYEKNMRIQELEAYVNENVKLRKDFSLQEREYEKLLNIAADEIARLRHEKKTFSSSYNECSDDNVKEIDSLRAVLEMKQAECTNLRKALAVAKEKAELLPGAEAKIRFLLNKSKDTEMLLKNKMDYELQLQFEIRKLKDSLQAELHNKSRLLQHVEELQWKLQQNKEVVSKLLGEGSGSSGMQFDHAQRNTCNGSTDSFNERYKPKTSLKMDDCSTHSMAVVKGVVEKSYSIGYILHIGDSPEKLPSRIMRRSYKNTVSKSPASRRQSVRNPLNVSLPTNL